MAQPDNINVGNAPFDGNNYTAAEWAQITAGGATFLPTGGMRYWFNPYGYYWYQFHWLYSTSIEGHYWASTGQYSWHSGPTLFDFDSDDVYTLDNSNNKNGFSVRLVKNYEGN